MQEKHAQFFFFKESRCSNISSTIILPNGIGYIRENEKVQSLNIKSMRLGQMQFDSKFKLQFGVYSCEMNWNYFLFCQKKMNWNQDRENNFKRKMKLQNLTQWSCLGKQKIKTVSLKMKLKNKSTPSLLFWPPVSS